MKRMRGWIAMVLLAISLSLGAGCTTGDALSTPTYALPEWAPPGATGVRYYYMPDMEIYYDLYTGNFIYWDGFGWSFGYSLPSAYRYHDLYNTHVILLDTRVIDPWLYHHHYISRYPKGYYYGPRSHPRNHYPSGKYPSRVYNENENKVDVPSAPRGISPSPGIEERSIRQPQQQPQVQPRFEQRPQIKQAPPRQVPPSQPQQRAPSAPPAKAPVKPGQGKG